MALIIVTGGTTGAKDGTPISQGGARTATLDFATVGTVRDVHIREDEDYYRASGTFSMCTELEVSFDGGSTYWGIASAPKAYGADIPDTNLAVKIKQVSAATTAAGTFGTGGDDTACTALGQVAGLTATRNGADGTKIDLAWTALADRTYYKVERATDSGFTANLTTLTSTATATTYQDTGRSDGVTYYYRVTGIGTGRFKDGTASASANATASSVFWADDFGDASINSTLWATDTADGGTVVETGGELVIDTNADVARKALLSSKRPVSMTTSGVFTINGVIYDTPAAVASIHVYMFPTAGRTITGDFSTDRQLMCVIAPYSGADYYSLRYYDTSSVAHYWTGSAWTTTPTTPANTWTEGDTYSVAIQSNGTQVRFILTQNGSPVTTTDYVNASDIKGGGDMYYYLTDLGATTSVDFHLTSVTYAAS